MPLTRDFKETVRKRAQRESGFREELLKSAVRCMLNGETEVGRIILSDYINSGKSCGDLKRMLNAGCDSPAEDLLALVAVVAEHEGIALDVQVMPRGHYERQLAA